MSKENQLNNINKETVANSDNSETIGNSDSCVNSDSNVNKAIIGNSDNRVNSDSNINKATIGNSDSCVNSDSNINKETIVAPITVVLTSPVIVVRISGVEAIKTFTLIQDRKGVSISCIEPNKVYFAKFISLYDGFCDDVLVTYFKAPYSYTGEDVVEISFHGNPILISSALRSFYDLGFRDARNGEFTMRAFLNDKISLNEAEAIQEFIASDSDISLRYAYEQMNGSVGTLFDTFKSELLNCKAILEADIDFAEDTDISSIYARLLTIVNPLLAQIEELLISYKSLRSISSDVNLVIVGKPNVGKSSLLNKLLDSNRAIVSSVAGTTRDFISERFLISGIPVTVTDTAGIRESTDEIESIGISKSLEVVHKADIVLILFDISDGDMSILDDKNLDTIINSSNSSKVIKVGNKSDLDHSTDLSMFDIVISSKTGDGVDKLLASIKDIVSSSRDIKPSSIGIVSERHAMLLDVVKSSLQSVVKNISNNFPEDMIIFDLNESIRKIEEITGEKYTEDILSIIFNKFCIGK